MCPMAKTPKGFTPFRNSAAAPRMVGSRVSGSMFRMNVPPQNAVWVVMLPAVAPSRLKLSNW